MNASTTGIWTLYQHTEQGRVPVAGATIAATDDVDGDVLFDFMTDHDIIDDWGQYETDGDREAVAVMAKHDGLPDFVWEFQQ